MLNLILMLDIMLIIMIKIGNHVRISKYKNIFAKRYAPNWPEEVFVIGKIKNAVPWTCYNGSKC